MPWHIVPMCSQCPEAKPWGVVKTDTGVVVQGGCHTTKAKALKHMAALYANEPEASRSMDQTRATFTVPVAEVEFAKSGASAGQRTMRGHAAVYDRLSHDMGGFRYKIAPGAFTKVLDMNPDVHLLWDHNTRYTLARTKNKTLELREDPLGLHVWARLADTPTANELATLMEGGYIDQMSFACEIGASEWAEDADGNITRTINEFDGIFDVTVCAQGAFPQTDAQMVVSLDKARAVADLEQGLAELGRSPEVVGAGSATDAAQETADVEGESAAAEEPGVEDVATVGVPSLTALKARAKARFAAVTRPE